MFFEAVFQPSSKMDYNGKAKHLEGKTIALQDGWVVKEGPFKGQNCFYIPNSTIGWIPQCDLIGLKPIPMVRCKEILKNLGFYN